MVLLATFREFPTGGWQLISLLLLEYVPVFTLTPRFILSIREAFARDIEGGCGGEIDSGFSFLSSDCNTSELPMVFMVGQQNGELEDNEEVRATEEV